MAYRSKVQGVVAALVAIGSAAILVSCEQKRHVVGSVNSEFKLIGSDHKLIVESYDHPKIDCITVFISKSQTGGLRAGSQQRSLPAGHQPPLARSTNTAAATTVVHSPSRSPTA